MIFGNKQAESISRIVGIGADVARVLIDNSLGDVTVETGRPGIVEVNAEFKAPDGEGATEQDVEVLTGDGKVRIRPLIKTELHKRRKVSLRVRIPMMMELCVRGGVGDIRATGLSGRHDLRTGVGDISVNAERVCGDSRFRAGTGKIEVHAHRIEGEPGLLTGVGRLVLSTGQSMITHASLKCATGNIYLNLPSTYIGRVDLKTAVGNINLEHDRGAIPVHSMLVGSRAQGALGQGPGDIEARTAVGTIVLNRT